MRIAKIKAELRKLQDEIDKIKLDENGKEKEKLTPEEYKKVSELMDTQDVLLADLKVEERAEERKEMFDKKEEPVTNKEQPKAETQGWRSFGEFLQSVIVAGTPQGESIAGRRGGTYDKRLSVGDEERAISGMSETVATDGGFLVGTDYANQLIQKAHDTGKLVKYCEKMTISRQSNSLKIPGIDESSRADGSRWGGIRVYWAAEGGSLTASKPKYRQINLQLNKMIGLSYLTDELIEDTVALEQFVSRGFAEEFGFKIDDGIVNGSGAGQPQGVYNANCLVSVAKETGQAATTIKAENIEKMYARMYAPSIGKAIWLINQDCWPQIFQLHHAVGTGGVPMFIPAGGINAAPYGTLLGRPIVPIEQCQTLGTKGDIYFADLSQYIFVDKASIQSASSIHIRFLYDEMVLRFVYRCDGQPIWNVALTPFKGSNTVSPFIALAVRS